MRNIQFIPGTRDFFFNSPLHTTDSLFYSHQPKASTHETKDKYTIELVAPGYDREDLKIGIQKDVLTISSQKENREEESEEAKQSTLTFRKFEKRYTLPELADTEAITADYKNGVLAIHIPKKSKEALVEKWIEIQ